MSNQLANESSPYLLQHAENPVNWHPWGPEALAKARDQDKPIFLSIGYSACHWCHVMEHESFENDGIARLLNDDFISIKVDREERPDLDQIYMNAVQLMTGRGGWPMSMFLTPELEPFFGGTYWPPTAGRGMPGFDQILASVTDAWKNRRQEALGQAAELTRRIGEIGAARGSAGELSGRLLHDAEAALEQAFDFTYGGFGSAPKFPHPMGIQLLLRIWRRRPRDEVLRMATLNLDKMAHGGIYDHLAGGFARYAVDDRWLVPHFEKMLYDNGLLAGAYLDGYLVTKDTEYARVAREICDYVLSYMTDEQGGFHSTEDADSEGVEGKFYVWTPAEIQQILGSEQAERFCYIYDVTDGGNFEGNNILNLPKTVEQCAKIKDWDLVDLQAELASSRAALLAVRDRRVRPSKDDKILVSWNGLMIDAMARASGILQEPRYLSAASRAAEFILGNIFRDDGRLLHTWRRGQAKLDAYLDDYACLANSLVSLYEAGFQERWIDQAVRLADVMMAHFRDTSGSGFFYTADDHEPLIARGKETHDSSVPSASAMAATVLLRLGKLCGRADYLTAAGETLQSAAGVMARAATASGQMLLALDMYLGPMPEIVILGDPKQADTADVLSQLCQRYIPNRVIACRVEADMPDGSDELDPIFLGKVAQGAPPTVYVCEKFTCQAPVSGKDAALATWDKLSATGKD